MNRISAIKDKMSSILHVFDITVDKSTVDRVSENDIYRKQMLLIMNRTYGPLTKQLYYVSTL